MLVSVLTPTHNPQWLQDTYDSLRGQTDVHWEWIVCPTPAALDRLPAEMSSDSRVRIIPQTGTEGRIGQAKKFCASHATGDVFVELDHDDLLAPGILAKVSAAVQDGAGFVFSDDALFVDASNGRRESVMFSRQFGWEVYPQKIWGRMWAVSRAFDVTPRSLCEVYYAPDHIRAWSRIAYERTGGHDESLEVGDDHDLMVRTYLKGFKFTHIPECGYLYRYHSTNSFKQKQQSLRQTVARTKAGSLWPLVQEWCHRNKYEQIPLTQDGQWTKRFDQPAGVFYGGAFFDDLPKRSMTPLLNELYSRLVPGGWILGEMSARNWSSEDFMPYCYRERAQEDKRIACRFQAVANQTTSDGQRLQIALSALKGQRQPGPIHI